MSKFYLVLSHILEVDGFASELAGSAEDAVQLANHRKPQAVVLDCRPALATGPAVCERLKGEARTCDVPVVALIAPGAQNQHLHLP